MKNTKKKASKKAVKEVKSKSIKTSKTKTNKPKIAPKNKTVSKTNKTVKSKTVLKPKKEVKTKTVNIKKTPEIKSDAVKNEKTTSKSSTTQNINNQSTKKHIGEVYWANNTKIDPTDTKKRRQYAVVRDNGKNVEVSKIRSFNGNPKNDDRLYKLDKDKYKLSKESGVDRKSYYERADNKKPLKLSDKQVFDNKPAFKMSSKDTHNVLVHTGKTSNKK